MIHKVLLKRFSHIFKDVLHTKVYNLYQSLTLSGTYKYVSKLIYGFIIYIYPGACSD